MVKKNNVEDDLSERLSLGGAQKKEKLTIKVLSKENHFATSSASPTASLDLPLPSHYE